MVYGFDFGTTNSLISVVENGRLRTFLDKDRNEPIPSVVCYEGTEKLVGHRAKVRLAEAGRGVYGNVVKSPKMFLGRSTLHVDGVARSVIDVVADVVRGVVAQSPTGRPVESVVATIPVDFNAIQRRALRDAYQAAGIRVRQFVHEPLAALYGHLRSKGSALSVARELDRKTVLVFDWGGGTLDLTLCRIESGHVTQLVNAGTDSVGGDWFDELISRELVEHVRKKRAYGSAVESRADAARVLLAGCERLKIDLSKMESATVFVDDFFADVERTEIAETVTRSELQRMTDRLIREGLGCVDSVLDRARLKPAQVDLCLATGGMLGMPAIRTRLAEKFGTDRVHTTASIGAAISQGAAWIAHDQATLTIARDVELALARQTHLKVIPGGAAMPLENAAHRDSFSMFCVDPRDGKAQFTIATPDTLGRSVNASDKRRPLAQMLLPVERSKDPFFERLRFDVELDHDLMLNCIATSELTAATVRCSVAELEFGLRLGGEAELHVQDGSGAVDGISSIEGSSHTWAGAEPGDLGVRSNLESAKSNWDAMPGELRHEFRSTDFNTLVTDGATQVQREEMTRYKPCGRCGKLWHECRCKSMS
jgi:molecular chaperone DnaK